ncbi:hypothetical protein WMY93_020119 [Mugilogobius chulae]|uniref:Uncharacterized protein n=1 Tax=Mugilogobius chulae TaxID=88201 RepID=A0AAW0NGF2_9GOBI
MATNPRSLFRASSLPDIGHSNDRMSLPPKDNAEIEPGQSRYERFFHPDEFHAFIWVTDWNEDYASRISRPPSLLSSPPQSDRFAGAKSSVRTHLDSPIRAGVPPLLQRSFSGDSGVGMQQGMPMFNNNVHSSHFQNQEPEPERNMMSKVTINGRKQMFD